jgi:hypothetical protein
MEISEYERRRNEHVLRRVVELQKHLECAGSADYALNNRIIQQSISLVSFGGSTVATSAVLTRKKNPKPCSEPLRRSERHIVRPSVEEKQSMGGEDIANSLGGTPNNQVRKLQSCLAGSGYVHSESHPPAPLYAKPPPELAPLPS